MAYSKKVVERFESVLNNPEKHSVGRFDPKAPDIATGMTGAPACGDVMKLQLKLDEDERIVPAQALTDSSQIRGSETRTNIILR